MTSPLPPSLRLKLLHCRRDCSSCCFVLDCNAAGKATSQCGRGPAPSHRVHCLGGTPRAPKMLFLTLCLCWNLQGGEVVPLISPTNLPSWAHRKRLHSQRVSIPSLAEQSQRRGRNRAQARGRAHQQSRFEDRREQAQAPVEPPRPKLLHLLPVSNPSVPPFPIC